MKERGHKQGRPGSASPDQQAVISVPLSGPAQKTCGLVSLPLIAEALGCDPPGSAAARVVPYVTDTNLGKVPVWEKCLNLVNPRRMRFPLDSGRHIFSELDVTTYWRGCQR